ncbi:DUF3231 family protein [Bacillus sp. UNC438CL73TsuS30]|uniref:DUF3231 family protein n=1 Tax=Bacillus sp. UNC438CL73TsuS30 TaxID=1340434 RepID=UPI0012DD25B6|nr:DUF3231 family protein [Bacillus sp. UNC438CL73TsuS30]
MFIYIFHYSGDIILICSIPEVALYVEDGANIMIKHGWMEEPPQAVDHDKLIQN